MALPRGQTQGRQTGLARATWHLRSMRGLQEPQYGETLRHTSIRKSIISL